MRLLRAASRSQVFTVKKAQVGQLITVTDKVKTLAANTRLEYRGHDPITLEDAIHLTNICLSGPAACRMQPL